jgi:hypothetical protein
MSIRRQEALDYHIVDMAVIAAVDAQEHGRRPRA